MLTSINNPEDLKDLKEGDLAVLCDDLRKVIIDTVSINGGHLASNLGIVELTVAIHRSFDLDNDKLIFDVGHQSYVHKLLTGRQDKFSSLRTFGGISGFPKTSESKYDHFNTGHSSTSISAAIGMASARDIKGDNYQVVSVIGDGALSGGMALEALNHGGSLKSKMIVILNDNEMSISENIGGISAYLAKINSNKIYRNWKNSINRVLMKTRLGRLVRRALTRIKLVLKYLFSKKGAFFSELGYTYFGPFDGHDIIGMEEGLKTAKNMNEPVIFHVLTKKGQGEIEAENNPEKFHGVSPKDNIPGKNLTEYFGHKICKMAEEDERITAITAAMTVGTGLVNFKNKFPDRFFDVSIAEQHGLTFAAGQGISGLHPFISIYSTFIQRGVDQVIHDISMQNIPVTIILDRAGVVGEDGETHQGVFDISLFKGIPNLTIMEPSDGLELEDMMEYSMKLNGPSIIRFPKDIGDPLENINHKELDIGEHEELYVSSGKNLICALGSEVRDALEVRKILINKGIEIDVISPRFISPISQKTINFIKKYENIFTIENHVLVGGYGEKLKLLLGKKSSIEVIALPNDYLEQGNIREVKDHYGLGIDEIARKIKRIVDEKK